MGVSYGIITDVLVLRNPQNVLLGFVELVMNQYNFCHEIVSSAMTSYVY